MSEPYVKVVLPGPPRGKGHHHYRIVYPKNGKRPFVQEYPHPETAKYEKELRSAAWMAMVGKRVLDEAVTVQIDALMPVPESWSRRARAEALRGDLCHTGKPDWDNIGKTLDAFKNIVWKDDAAVIEAVVRKYYSETPCLIVQVWRWL